MVGTLTSNACLGGYKEDAASCRSKSVRSLVLDFHRVTFFVEMTHLE